MFTLVFFLYQFVEFAVYVNFFISVTTYFTFSEFFSSVLPGDFSLKSEWQQVSLGFPGRCPCGVMVKVMDCRIVVCEFVLQLRYYVHFRANTLGRGMNPLILPAMG